ncbi:diguanylate cyclase domain-containing protein [Thermodesulfobacteriota bacterium]
MSLFQIRINVNLSPDRSTTNMNDMNDPQNQLPILDTPTAVIRSSMRLFFIIFMLTGALISGTMMVFYRSEIKTQFSNLQIQETFAIELQSQVVGDILDSIVHDLFFLSQQNELIEYLDNSTPGSLDDSAREYLAIAQQKKIYDQIRFIDGNGLETVRVNYNQGSPEQVTRDKLQSKQKRYYFKDSYELEKGAIFISPFDLNVEKGVIEKPLKPMIRLATPVFDSANQKRGIIILNYLGINLLDKILESESVATGQTMLLNSDGYWLLSPSPDQAWGFMFEDEHRTFQFLYKDIWEEIRIKKKGQINTPNGLFTFKTIFPLKKGHRSSTGSGKAYGASEGRIDHTVYQWHLVSFAPSHIINSYADHLLKNLFFLGAGIFLLIAGGSWIIALAVTKRRIYQARLKVMALFDPLTELPNRRLFFDRLHMTLELSRRNNNIFSLLYIDLDGFKKINDALGHEAGDELLRKVAKLLHQQCRKSDSVARLGGDEFAIIIGQLESPTGAEVVAEKIIASITSPIQLTAGSGHVGASIGISLFPADSEDAGELVRLADKAMYRSKRQGKNTYTFSSADSHG